MTESQIETAVKNVFVNILGLDGSEMIPSAELVDDLGMDSLDAIEIIMSLEEAFEIEIDDSSDEVYAIRTFADATNFIKRELCHQSRSRRGRATWRLSGKICCGKYFSFYTYLRW